MMRSYVAELPEDHPGASDTRLDLAWVEAAMGNEPEALELTRRVMVLAHAQPQNNYLVWVALSGKAARVFARARRADLAVPLLDRLLSSPGTGDDAAYARLRLDPAFEPIRNDPAFQTLLAAHPGSGDIPD